jgi:hypothetical protein
MPDQPIDLAAAREARQLPPSDAVACPDCGDQWFAVRAVTAYRDDEGHVRLSGYTLPLTCNTCRTVLT